MPYTWSLDDGSSNPEGLATCTSSSPVIHHEVRWPDGVLCIAHEFVIIEGATGHNLSKNLDDVSVTR